MAVKRNCAKTLIYAFTFSGVLLALAQSAFAPPPPSDQPPPQTPPAKQLAPPKPSRPWETPPQVQPAPPPPGTPPIGTPGLKPQVQPAPPPPPPPPPPGTPPIGTPGLTSYKLYDRDYAACTPVTIYLADEKADIPWQLDPKLGSIGEITGCQVVGGVKGANTCTYVAGSAGPLTFHCTTKGARLYVLITYRPWQAGGSPPLRQAWFYVDCI